MFIVDFSLAVSIMPSDKGVSLDTAVIRCSVGASDAVKRELTTLRASHSHLSNRDWKHFAESEFKRRRQSNDAQLSISSHGGY